MGSFATGLNQRQSEYASYAAVSEHWWLSCQDNPVPQGLLAYTLPRHRLGEAVGKHRAVPQCYEALLIMLRSMIRSTRLANGCALECGLRQLRTCRRHPGQLCGSAGRFCWQLFPRVRL